MLKVVTTVMHIIGKIVKFLYGFVQIVLTQ